MSKYWVTPSRSSPKPGGNRACLCKNGTYSRKCCDGSLQAQGVGPVSAAPRVSEAIITEDGEYLITQNNDRLITN